MLPIKIQLPDSFFKEETKCGFTITRQSKELMAVLLDLLVEFDSVCRKNGLKYMLDSGTLLGALRHDGFIPWDNDVDVVMLREEYDKLIKIAPEVFKQPYYWQDNETDPGSLRRHGQLRNSATTCILRSEMEGDKPLCTFNQGAFLDVFIMDAVPDEEEELCEFSKELTRQISLQWELKQLYFRNGCDKWIEDAILKGMRSFESYVAQYNGKGCQRVANISLIPVRKDNTFFDRKLFEEFEDYTFEGYRFMGPKDADAILTGYYGDWHKFVIGNDSHGDLLMDMHRPYTDYLAGFRMEDKDVHPLSEIILQRDDLRTECEDTKQKLYRAWRDYESEHSMVLKEKEMKEAVQNALEDTRKQLARLQEEHHRVITSRCWRYTKIFRR